MWRPAASTSTTSAPSSTTSRPRTPRTTSTGPGARPAPGATAGPITLVEYNQHTQMRILQRTLQLPLTPPIEVFSNDERLRDLSRFHEGVVDSTVPTAR